MSPGFIERTEGGRLIGTTIVEPGKEESIIVAKALCDPSEGFTAVISNVPPEFIAIRKYSSEGDKQGIAIKEKRTDVRGPQIVEVTSPLLNQIYKIRHQTPDEKNRMGRNPRQRA